MIHLGERRTPAGRIGEAPAIGLSDAGTARACHGAAEDRHPAAAGWPHHRLGAAWRCSRRCPAGAFSFLTDAIDHPQIDCRVTRTTEETHAIIASEPAPFADVFAAQITGRGPRYCPSIEDKVVRFADRDAPPDLPRAGGPG